MKKHDESLFQIGEVTKIMGITRKTLLVFVDMELLTPVIKDEESGLAIRALMQYVKENNIEVAGPFRSIYMEGPPNRGDKKENYITQIDVPIKS